LIFFNSYQINKYARQDLISSAHPIWLGHEARWPPEATDAVQLLIVKILIAWIP
jgi:hypothetical protein